MGLQLALESRNAAANYVDLRTGNHTPAVGVLQKLLKRGGARIAADGEFGDQTRQAVVAFQRARHLSTDGIVGQITWPLEGPTQTAVPAGESLRQWCSTRPDFAGMSVA